MKNILLIASILLSVNLSAQKLVNLGSNINEPEHTDCYPEISPDGRTLYFSRQSYPGDKGGYDIYSSTKDENGEWQKAKPIVELNNENKNFVFYSSPNGDELVLFGTYGDDAKEEGYSITHRTSSGWSFPEPMVIRDADKIQWGSNGCTFSSDGQVMILAIQQDLHLSFKQEDDSWSFPINIGSPCNTENIEFTPFLSDDNKTLYFSSNGHETLGSNDIVKSTRLDGTWMNWSKPVNVGAPINSPGWESFFNVPAQGDYAMVYSLNEGSGDLFKVPITEDMRPESVVILRGKIADAESGDFIVNADVKYASQTDDKVLGSATIHKTTSEYKVVLHYGHVYEIKGLAPDYASFVETIDLTKAGPYQEIEQDIMLVPLRKGANLKLDNIQFEVNESVLLDASFITLNKVVKMMKENPNLKIELLGHTDNEGSAESNLLLSKERAAAVVAYLVSKGISRDRLTSEGLGETKPIADNTTDKGRQLNRRVELVITSFE